MATRDGATNLVEFLMRSPLAGLDLKLERDRDSGRDTDHPFQVRKGPVSRCTKSDLA
jgi:hypothetical protein